VLAAREEVAEHSLALRLTRIADSESLKRVAQNFVVVHPAHYSL
jgi:hypothetical protein